MLAPTSEEQKTQIKINTESANYEENIVAAALFAQSFKALSSSVHLL